MKGSIGTLRNDKNEVLTNVIMDKPLIKPKDLFIGASLIVVGCMHLMTKTFNNGAIGAYEGVAQTFKDIKANITIPIDEDNEK